MRKIKGFKQFLQEEVVGVRLSADLKQLMLEHADQNDLNVSQIIRKSIKQYLESRRDKGQWLVGDSR